MVRVEAVVAKTSCHTLLVSLWRMRISGIVTATWLLLITFFTAFKGVISQQYEVQFTGEKFLDDEISRFVSIGRYVASARIPSRCHGKNPGSLYTVKFGKAGYFQVLSETKVSDRPPHRLKVKVETKRDREIEGWELEQLTESALRAMDRKMENIINYEKRKQQFLQSLKQSVEFRDTNAKEIAGDSKTEQIAKNQEMGKNSIANIQQAAKQIWDDIREETAKFRGNSGEEGILKRDRKGHVVSVEPLEATGEVVSESGKSLATQRQASPGDHAIDFPFPEDRVVSMPLCVADPPVHNPFFAKPVLVEQPDPAERSCHLVYYTYSSGSVYDKENQIVVSYILYE